MKKKEKEKVNEDSMDWDNSAQAELNSSEWFGAILRYLMHFGSIKFNKFYSRIEQRKNAIIGYIFKVLLVVIAIIIGYYYYKD